MLRKLVLLGIGLFFLLVLPLAAQEIPFKVAASIPPLCDLVKQVGGERVEVIQLVPNGFNPHAYEPTPREIRNMLEAKGIFLIGLGLDTAFERLLRRVDETKPVYFPSESLEFLHAEDHHHHEEEEHEEEGEGEFTDPHVWISLRNAVIMVDNIARFLSELDPEGSSLYVARARDYQEKLRTLDSWFQEKIAGVPNRGFVTSHNAWSYLSRDYDLRLLGVIEKAPEREPTPQELQELITVMEKENVRVIFVEPQFNQKIAQVLAAETGAKLLVLDPLGSFPDLPYLTLMEQNLSQILEGFTAHAEN